MPALFEANQRTEYDWQFYAESETACGALNGSCFWPRGKLLGGSSAINLMIYARGNPCDYDNWAAKGNTGWDYESVLPFFKKSEANHFLPFVYEDKGRYHNGTGPMNVDFYGDCPFAKVFIDAAIEAGYEFVSDMNADKFIGYLKMQGTCYQGRRQSTAKAFLVPIKDRTNLHVVRHGLVKKVLLNKRKRAYGITYVRNKKTIEARARK